MTSLIACSQQAEYFFCLIGMHWRIYNEKNVYRAKISELEPCGFYRKEHQRGASGSTASSVVRVMGAGA